MNTAWHFACWLVICITAVTLTKGEIYPYPKYQDFGNVIYSDGTYRQNMSVHRICGFQDDRFLLETRHGCNYLPTGITRENTSYVYTLDGVSVHNEPGNATLRVAPLDQTATLHVRYFARRQIWADRDLTVYRDSIPTGSPIYITGYEIDNQTCTDQAICEAQRDFRYRLSTATGGGVQVFFAWGDLGSPSTSDSKLSSMPTQVRVYRKRPMYTLFYNRGIAPELLRSRFDPHFYEEPYPVEALIQDLPNLALIQSDLREINRNKRFIEDIAAAIWIIFFEKDLRATRETVEKGFTTIQSNQDAANTRVNELGTRTEAQRLNTYATYAASSRDFEASRRLLTEADFNYETSLNILLRQQELGQLLLRIAATRRTKILVTPISLDRAQDLASQGAGKNLSYYGESENLYFFYSTDFPTKIPGSLAGDWLWDYGPDTKPVKYVEITPTTCGIYIKPTCYTPTLATLLRATDLFEKRLEILKTLRCEHYYAQKKFCEYGGQVDYGLWWRTTNPESNSTVQPYEAMFINGSMVRILDQWNQSWLGGALDTLREINKVTEGGLNVTTSLIKEAAKLVNKITTSALSIFMSLPAIAVGISAFALVPTTGLLIFTSVMVNRARRDNGPSAQLGL